MMDKSTNLPKGTKAGLRPTLIWIVFVFLALSCNDDDIDLSPLPDLKITEIEPLTARVGGEVVITGTGFDTEYISRNDVDFTATDSAASAGDVLVKKATATQLTVIVPDSPEINGPVKVTVRGQEAVSSQDFVVDNSMPAPVISEVRPNSGIANDEIVITGKYFVEGNILPTVFIGNKEVEPDSIEDEDDEFGIDEITITVPEGLEPGEVMITVQRGAFTSNQVAFTINAIPVEVKETYWTDSDGNIKRGIIQEDGVQIETLYENNAAVNGLVIDAQRELIYWADNSRGDGADIYSAPIDGSGTPQIVLSLNDDPSNFISYTIYDIALDRQANVLYFEAVEEGFDFDTGLPAVNVVVYKGNPGSITVHALNTISIENKISISTGLKIDPVAGKFYAGVSALDFFTGESTGAVYKGNLDGSGTLEVLFDTSDGLTDEVRNIALNPDSGKLYILDNDFSPENNTTKTTIYSGNMDGSGNLIAITEIINSESGVPVTDLEIDLENGFLFWINSALNGVIKRVALDGSVVEDLFTGINNGEYFDLKIE
ncbi:IPT/TIG domain-containing protein [Sinomicrobium sp. M5D2P9]